MIGMLAELHVSEDAASFSAQNGIMGIDFDQVSVSIISAAEKTVCMFHCVLVCVFYFPFYDPEHLLCLLWQLRSDTLVVCALQLKEFRPTTVTFAPVYVC